MTVQQVIDLAAQGELKNLAVKTDTNTILGYINLGMIEMYKRFPLMVSEYMVELVEGVEMYTMPSDFLWIVAAYGEVQDSAYVDVIALPINEEDNPLSLNTVSYNTVQIPLATDNAYVSIIYRAGPEYIVMDELGSPIKLPPQMLEPLLHYIGYRGHLSVTTTTNEQATHYSLFEQACARIEAAGMFTSDDVLMPKRISNRGFK